VAKQVARLSDLSVKRAKRPGMYADGDGLYLQVTKKGDSVAKSWIYRFMLGGRAREMGLGSLRTVDLKEARARATKCRAFRDDGVDPIEERKATRAKAKLEAASTVTFGECVKSYIAAHKPGWRNAKHAQQWENTLRTYVDPILGALPIQAIDTGLVLKALEPIWNKKSETAGRVRGRIETILDWATARGYRQGENPARWRGHLDKLLPKRSKLRQVRHHPALPFDQVPDFIAALQQQKGIAARALEFLILTASRTGEVIGARPSEIAEGLWTVPASRMKRKKEHRVPLPRRALEIVEEMRRDYGGEFLFPGAKRGKHLSNMAMLELMRGMKREDGKPWSDRHGDAAVPHGFRSSFRDWASELTNYPREVVEMSLAHAIDDKVEAAYRRGELLEKRRGLMAEWERYCAAEPSSTIEADSAAA
jgi:integrase